MQEQWQEFNNTFRGGDMSWGKERAQKFQSPNFFVKGVFFSGFEPSLTKMPEQLNFFLNNKFSEKVFKSKKKVNILTMVKGC